MFVPCPHCGFSVALIVSDDGPPQHCPRCDGRLQSADDDASAPDIAANAEPAIAAPVSDEMRDSQTHDRDPLDAVIAAAPASIEPPSDGPRVTPGAAAATLRRPAPRSAPSFARTSASAMPTGPRWPGLVAVGVLLLVLVTQLLLVQRNELAASARWRPMIGAICAALQCDLPPWREPAAFTMLNRSVQPDPRTAGVLSVNASFRNDARWPQPWPTLVLSLADVDGRTVGQRAFLPGEYRGPTAPPLELAPGQSASVRFEIVEPTPRIVAFTFEFG